MAKRQVLFDPINVRWPDNRRFSHGPSAFGAFTLHQMASARAPEKDFAGGLP